MKNTNNLFYIGIIAIVLGITGGVIATGCKNLEQNKHTLWQKEAPSTVKEDGVEEAPKAEKPKDIVIPSREIQSSSQYNNGMRASAWALGAASATSTANLSIPDSTSNVDDNETRIGAPSHMIYNSEDEFPKLQVLPRPDEGRVYQLESQVEPKVIGNASQQGKVDVKPSNNKPKGENILKQPEAKPKDGKILKQPKLRKNGKLIDGPAYTAYYDSYYDEEDEAYDDSSLLVRAQEIAKENVQDEVEEEVKEESAAVVEAIGSKALRTPDGIVILKRGINVILMFACLFIILEAYWYFRTKIANSQRLFIKTPMAVILFDLASIAVNYLIYIRVVEYVKGYW